MPESGIKPVMYLIAGPNGAGKTSFYEHSLKPAIPAEYVNADDIEKAHWPNEISLHSYEAARMAADRRSELIAQGSNFITETVFSHPSKLELIKMAQAAGYAVHLFHIHVRTADISVARVELRVRKGGHNVPEDKNRARHQRNPALIRQAALISDHADVFDGSVMDRPARWLMSFDKGQIRQITASLPAWACTLYADELKAYSPSRRSPLGHSRQEVCEILHQLYSQDIKITPVSANAQYIGAVVAESRYHLAQLVSDPSEPHPAVVIHLKKALSSPLQMGDNVQITYGGQGRLAVVRAVAS